MRPLELRVKAFGPFADEQIIDFTAISDRTLFLIHGPTGSGKTSVLDALCFALYGQTSVSDRPSTTIRSHHADASVQTEVSLSFKIGPRVFRIERVPEQLRPKSRGEGFTRQTASAILFQKSDAPEKPEWEILADRWNRVTEKIEEILGFKCDQFRQVVMLPQGEFRKLLNASSQEKQTILAILFKTGLYRHIEDILKEKSKEIKQSYDSISSQIAMYLESSSCNSIDELEQKMTSLAQSLVEVNENRATLQTQEEGLLKVIAEKQIALTRFIELESAQAAFNALQKQQPAITFMQQDFEKAVKAAQLQPFEQTLTKCNSEIQTHTRQLEQNQIALSACQQRFDEVQKRQQEIPSLEKRREQLSLELDRIKNLLPKISRLDEARTAFQHAEQKLASCKNDLTNQKQHLESIIAALNKLKENHNKLQEQAGSLELLKVQYRDFETQKKNIEKIVQLDLEIKEVNNALLIQTTHFSTTCSEIESKQQILECLEKLQYEHRAALLALTLQDSVPCPVCGSTSHPHPAQSDTTLPDEKQIVLLKKELKKSESTKESQRIEIGKKEHDLVRLQKEHALLCEQSGQTDITQAEQIDTVLKKLTSDLQNAKLASDKLLKTAADIERGEKAHIESEKKISELSETHNAMLQTLSIAQAEYKTLYAEIPLEYNNSSSITGKQQQITIEITSITNKIITLRDDLEKLLKEKSFLEATGISINERLIALNGDLKNSSSQFLDQIKSAGFTDEIHYKAAVKSDAEIVTLRNTLDSFNRQQHSANDRMKRALTECEYSEKPEVELYEKQLRELKKEIGATISRQSEIQSQLSQLEQKRSELQKLYQKAKLSEKEYSMAASLSDVCSGNNSMRITFERFVLASLLDDVLAAGTERLAIMSQNRYSLHRAKTHLDLRTSGGLELMVFDSYTGISRPAGSLSGGESFLAALSLALGLADVVQSYSGGIVLDTLFIDEGFGSLDSEALDCAFQALADIGKSGRMVGVISHVSELKERIDTRLELVNGKHGSSVAFNIY
jgi:exonuclease SbcC